ncbi:UvrD-helicase domain-containing protein [Streptomyces sp. B6B3]|uniref:UvrD-helicase domain-containing protein n=1 Tax=Streptomyces sp. B6B3 TaxID=3153570 RepID=UPI00325DEE43
MSDVVENTVHQPSRPTSPRFRPRGQEDLAPSGPLARVQANIAALRTLRALRDEQRPATPAEQHILARWSSWGAVPGIFDPRQDELAEHRTELRPLLSDEEWHAAEATTRNAHFTDAALVQPIWQALQDLGFRDGRVLEPGCGSGNFLAFAPPEAQLTGVELDPVTAEIAAALYPDAALRAESFVDTRLPEGYFDAAIGNVPFDEIALTDPVHNPMRLATHNHFIVKSLELVRPGGLVAVLTSRYTLDSTGRTARLEIADRADLVGAVRLPAGAHRRAAGTDVVTDLLILRRRDGKASAVPQTWARLESVRVGPDATALVNAHFAERPDMVLGTLGMASNQYGRDELTVHPHRDADLPEALSRALSTIVDEAREAGLTMTATPDAAQRAAVDQRAERMRRAQEMFGAELDRFEGTLLDQQNGSFLQVVGGELAERPVFASAADELRSLLRLRDTYVELLGAESTGDEQRATELRQQLNQRYDAHTTRYGCLNRRETRRDRRSAHGAFRTDPYAAGVYALEIYDKDTGTAKKSAIFTRPVSTPRAEQSTADTPQDALAITLNAHGEVRLDEIARLLGADSLADARTALGELVYEEPGGQRLVPAAEYLSGNVRQKLERAESLLRAVAEEERAEHPLQVNVAALRRALPPDKQPGDIEDVQFGATWIEPKYYEQFLRQLLQTRNLTVTRTSGADWEVEAPSAVRRSRAATKVYGTRRRNAVDLAERMLRRASLVVHPPKPDNSATPADIQAGKRWAAEQTEQVIAKQEELSRLFADWLWQDPERTKDVLTTYNRLFNSYVPYQGDGSHLTFPGLSDALTPRPHQRAGVARALVEPGGSFFDYEVGFGKTLTIAMTLMEMRRLGMVRKPCVVVKNATVNDFRNDFLKAYPAARVLAIDSSEFTKETAAAYVAQIANGDWDAVILPQTLFKRIPMSGRGQQQFVADQTAEYRALIHRVLTGGDAALAPELNPGGDPLISEALDAATTTSDPRERGASPPSRDTVKKLQGDLKRHTQRAERNLVKQSTTGICWEQTGIDFITVDEVQDFANAELGANNSELALPVSAQSKDLKLKLHATAKAYGPKAGLGSTGTPFPNAMPQAYVMLDYFRPDLLAAAEIQAFSSFQAQYLMEVVAPEISPEGTPRIKERIGAFRNARQFHQLWKSMADVRTKYDIHLPIPQHISETVVVPATETDRSYMAEIAERAEDVRGGSVDVSTDNLLKISNDGRMAAMDLRMVGKDPDGPGKLDAAADTIARTWQEFRDRTYTDREGTPSPLPGALQLVFADRGTPSEESRKRGRFIAYDYLRDELIERGVPAGQIRYAQDARTAEEKESLFSDCRQGKVAVLIGSTDTMGVGVNVQDRAIALHHLDCPWRPSDVTQREGRIIRQFNQHLALDIPVRIYRWVKEGSFDSFMWQTVERKARFIDQVRTGRDLEEQERALDGDLGKDYLEFGEIKAIATGNPLLLKKLQADEQVRQLDAAYTNWKRTNRHLRTVVDTADDTLARAQNQADLVGRAARARTETKGDAFRMELPDGTIVTKRQDAAAALRTRLALMQRTTYGETGTWEHLATLGGQPFQARVNAFHDFAEFAIRGLDDVPQARFAINDVGALVTDGKPLLGLVTRLENQAERLDTLHAKLLSVVDEVRQEIDRAHKLVDQPFTKLDKLNRARAEQAQIEAEIAARVGGASNEDSGHEAAVGEERPAREATATPYVDRTEYWAAEGEALDTYLAWKNKFGTGLADGTEAQRALAATADAMLTQSRESRQHRLLGLHHVVDWTTVRTLADRARTVAETWDREQRGHDVVHRTWEMATTLRDHAARYRATVEDQQGETFRRWAATEEPVTLDDDGIDFIPGLSADAEYTVTGPGGQRTDPITGARLVTGIARLMTDGMTVERIPNGLRLTASDGTHFELTSTTSAPPKAVEPPGPEPKPAEPTTDDVPGSANPRARNLAILLGTYTDGGELVAGRALVAEAITELHQALDRNDVEHPPDLLDSAADDQATPETAFSTYDRLATAASTLADATEGEVAEHAHRLAQRTERHLGRMHAAGRDLFDLLLDASALDPGSWAVLTRNDPLKERPAAYSDSEHLNLARTILFQTYDRWPDAPSDSGGENSERLRAAMWARREEPDTPIGTALPRWMEVVSYALGAAEEAGPDASRTALRDLAQHAHQHHQALASYHLAAARSAPYESADAFIGGADQVAGAWDDWMLTATARRLTQRRDESPDGSLATARAAQEQLREDLRAAEDAATEDGTLDDVTRRTTKLAHATYALTLSLREGDYHQPDDLRALTRLVKASYAHAASCRSSSHHTETSAAVRDGLTRRREQPQTEQRPPTGTSPSGETDSTDAALAETPTATDETPDVGPDTEPPPARAAEIAATARANGWRAAGTWSRLTEYSSPHYELSLQAETARGERRFRLVWEMNRGRHTYNAQHSAAYHLSHRSARHGFRPKLGDVEQEIRSPAVPPSPPTQAPPPAALESSPAERDSSQDSLFDGHTAEPPLRQTPEPAAPAPTLTADHLASLPRHPRPPHDADARLAVITTLRLPGGEVPETVLLLQSVEVDEDNGEDPVVLGAQIVPSNDVVVSTSLNGRWFPADLLTMADARVLPLPAPLPWPRVEELAQLPHHEVLNALRLPHQPAAMPAAVQREPDQSADPATTAQPQEEESVTTVIEPVAPAGPWTSRIQIITDGGATFVTGTGGAHWQQEAELRTLLKTDRNFTFRNGRWRYQGPDSRRDRVMEEIRTYLLAKDAQEEAAETARPAAPEYPPTPQQQAIIDACLAGQDVAVQALAGTGKTSTLQMVTRRMPDKRIAYVAFNRSIADEAKRKFPRNVTADTSHSFARAALRNTPLKTKIETAGRNGGARRPKDVAKALGLTKPLRYEDGGVEPDDVARMAMAAVRRFRESADAELGPQHLDAKWADTPAAPGLLDVARRAWADIADPAGDKLFFSHDDYLKLWALTHPRLTYDVILFDEAQDINPVLKKVIQDQNAQTIVVGDSNQSIYEFRGAIDALKDWPADVVLPLTQSWRFGPEVAAVGNDFLRLLDSDLTLEGNPALESALGPVDDPDAVLTRTNVGAIGAVFAGFEDGKRVALVGGGRDIEEIAKAARDLQRGRRTTHPELGAFESWNEVREYAETEDDRTLQMFVRLVDRYTPEGLLGMIGDLVPEDAADAETRPELVVSTAHKAKGREWDHVRIGTDFPQPTENTETGDIELPLAEELRLAYVTVTRAKKRLEIASLGWIDTVGETAPRPTAPTGTAIEPTVHEPTPAPHTPTDEPQPTPQPKSPPLTLLTISAATQKQLRVSVTVDGGASRSRDLPGLSPADLPSSFTLPVTGGLPALLRPPALTPSLLSTAEVTTWLNDHLPSGPLATAWQTDATRTALTHATRDALRDTMAPALEEVATWLVEASVLHDDVIRTAHTMSPDDFAVAFERIAENLIRDDGSEHLLWGYLGTGADRRDAVLALAVPRAYRELRRTTPHAPVPDPREAQRTADASPTPPQTSTDPQAPPALPWDEEKIRRRGQAGLLRARIGAIPDLARQIGEAVGDERARTVWEEDHPLAQFDANVSHTLAGFGDADTPTRSFVAERATELSTQIEAIANRAARHYYELILPNAADPTFLTSLDHQLTVANRPPEPNNPFIREGLVLVLRAIDEAESAARGRKLKPTAVRKALEQIAGLAGHDSTNGELYPNIHAALTPIRAELDSTRVVLAELRGDTAALDEYARLRQRIADHQHPSTTPTDSPTPKPAPAPEPETEQETPQPAPLTNHDIAAALGRLSPWDFGQLIATMDQKKKRYPRLHDGYFRIPTTPDGDGPSSWASAFSSRSGLDIKISVDDTVVRAGRVTWARALKLLRPAVTPLRRDLVVECWRTDNAMRLAEDAFSVIGERSRAETAARELNALLSSTKSTIITDSLGPETAANEDQHAAEETALRRVRELAAVLPSGRTAMKSFHEVQPGDVLLTAPDQNRPFLARSRATMEGNEVLVTGDLLLMGGATRPHAYRRTTNELGLDTGVQILLLPKSLTGLIDVPTEPSPLRAVQENQPPQPFPDNASFHLALERLRSAHDAWALSATAQSDHITDATTQITNAWRALAETAQHENTEPAPLIDAYENLISTATLAGRSMDEHHAFDSVTDRRLLQAMITAAREQRARLETTPTLAPASPPPDRPVTRNDLEQHFDSIVTMLQADTAPRQSTAPPTDTTPQQLARLTDQIANLRDLLNRVLGDADTHPVPQNAPEPRIDAADAATLDAAAGHAHDQIGDHEHTPEWARIHRLRHLADEVRHAVHDAVTTASNDIWSPTLDRTLQALTAQAVSAEAVVLAQRLERDGERDSAAWEAVWRLHRAATTRADRLAGLLHDDQRLDFPHQLRHAWQRLASHLPTRPDNATPSKPQMLIASGLATLTKAHHQALDRIGDLAQHPAWRAITAVYESAREVLDTAWLGAHRLSADDATLGTARMLWVRTLELISHGARRLLDHLNRTGHRDGLRWNALRVLHHAAEDHISHLRGHLPTTSHSPLGTYYEPSLFVGEQLTLHDEWDQLHQAANIVTATKFASPVALHRRMDIGHREAVSLLDRLEELQIVGPPSRGRLREVLVDPETAERTIDKAQSTHPSEPRWAPTHEPFTNRWFHEVRATLPRDPARRDLLTLLFHEHQRVARGETDPAQAGQRANHAVTLHLTGRTAEIPDALTGHSHVEPELPQPPPPSTATPAPPEPLRTTGESSPAQATQTFDQCVITQRLLAEQAGRLQTKARLTAAVATNAVDRDRAELLLRLAENANASAAELITPGQTTTSSTVPLLAEPFLAALRTHAAARSVVLPDDVIQDAWTAALRAIASSSDAMEAAGTVRSLRNLEKRQHEQVSRSRIQSLSGPARSSR